MHGGRAGGAGVLDARRRLEAQAVVGLQHQRGGEILRREAGVEMAEHDLVDIGGGDAGIGQRLVGDAHDQALDAVSVMSLAEGAVGLPCAQPTIETNGPVLERQHRIAAVVRQRRLDDIRPVRREIARVGTLDLDADQALRPLRMDEFLPVRPGRPPRSHPLIAAHAVTELDEGGAAVARMKLCVLIGVAVDDMRNPHADRFGMGLSAPHVAGLKDRHVAAMPPGAFDETSGGGVRPVSARPLQETRSRSGSARSQGRIWRRYRRDSRRPRRRSLRCPQ
jgi:hypothetical protein